MDKAKSMELLAAWVNHVANNVPDSKIYWEENVIKGQKLGELTKFPKFTQKLIGMNKKAFFVDSDRYYAGYVDPNNLDNSYFLSIHSYLKVKGLTLNLSLDTPNLGNWVDTSQHIINPNGTYTYVWGGSNPYDITDLVLGNTARFKFLNWNENPFEVK